MKKSPSVTYCGVRLPEGAHVTITTKAGQDVLPLAPSLRLRNHSPTGFEWGYMGSGPAQLALAILLDYYGDAGLAQARYQLFKAEVVSLFAETWTLTGAEIDAAMARAYPDRPLR